MYRRKSVASNSELKIGIKGKL